MYWHMATGRHMPKSAQGQTMPRDFWQPLPSSDLKLAITGLWGVAFREALGMGTWADGWEELGFFETALHSNLGNSGCRRTHLLTLPRLPHCALLPTSLNLIRLPTLQWPSGKRWHLWCGELGGLQDTCLRKGSHQGRQDRKRRCKCLAAGRRVKERELRCGETALR